MSHKEPELREQDRWLPIANVARLMKNTLPASAKVSKDAKECMQECVSEFISFITSEASDNCSGEKRKTINGEDILLAMTVLGFENYSEALKIYLTKYRQQQALKQERAEQRKRHSNSNGSQAATSGSGSGNTKSENGSGSVRGDGGSSAENGSAHETPVSASNNSMMLDPNSGQALDQENNLSDDANPQFDQFDNIDIIKSGPDNLLESLSNNNGVNTDNSNANNINQNQNQDQNQNLNQNQGQSTSQGSAAQPQSLDESTAHQPFGVTVKVNSDNAPDDIKLDLGALEATNGDTAQQQGPSDTQNSGIQSVDELVNNHSYSKQDDDVNENGNFW